MSQEVFNDGKVVTCEDITSVEYTLHGWRYSVLKLLFPKGLISFFKEIDVQILLKNREV
jgi:hypothetical protein